MAESVNKKTVKDIMLKHKDKKIYQVVSHLSDIIIKKNWEIKIIRLTQNYYTPPPQ